MQSHRLKSIKMKRNNILFVIVRIVIVTLAFAVLSVGTAICVDCESNIQADMGSILDVFPMMDGGFAVLSEIDGCYTINFVSQKLEVRSVNTEIKTSGSMYTYNNDTFIFAYSEYDNDISRRSVNIMFYDSNDDYSINKTLLLDDGAVFAGIASDSKGKIYIAEKSAVNIFDSDLAFDKKLDAQSDIKQMKRNTDGESIYCITDKDISIIQSGEIREIPVTASDVFPANGYFSDENGTLYNNEGDVLYSGFTGTHGSVVSGELFLGIKNGIFTAVKGSVEKSVAVSSENTFLCVNNDVCLLAESGDNTKLDLYTLSEIEELLAKAESTDSDTEKTQKDDTITHEYTYITDLPQGCTAAQFRSIYGDDYLFYTPDGSLRSSGILGTGIRAVAPNSGQRYIIVVFGDVSGDGRITDKDKAEMTSILFGNNADDEFLLACDIDRNSIVDLTDLTALDIKINDNIM